MMEEFSTALHRQTGLMLTSQQIMKLYTHYYDVDTKVIDYQRFYADVLDKAIIKAKESLEKEESSQFDKTMQKLSDCVEKKLTNDCGRDRLKPVYRLISESRSPVITRLQLKTASLTRLNCPLQDFEIDCIFKKLDNLRVGSVRTRVLIDAILSKIPVPQKASLSTVAQDETKQAPTVVGNDAARMTYDHKFVNLHAPDPALCPMYSVWDLENIVRKKITETSTASNNMLKTARRLFGDGGHSSGDLEISRDQLRYTFWKVLRVDVADRDIERFFQKYQHNDVITLSDLMEGIIKKEAVEEPMLEDLTMSHSIRAAVETKIHQNNSLDAFFTQLRYE